MIRRRPRKGFPRERALGPSSEEGVLLFYPTRNADEAAGTRPIHPIFFSVMGEQEEGDCDDCEQQCPLDRMFDAGVGSMFGGEGSSCYDSCCKRSISGSGLFHF